MGATSRRSNAATAATRAANAAVRDRLRFEDERDVADATRGLIAPLPDGGVIRDAHGHVVFDASRFDYLDAPAPDTVNPSLWRQAGLLRHAGLFTVVDRVYQVRNHDLANVTIIEGDGGLVVIDTGSNAECAHAAMELYYAHRPTRLPVVAVIYTHPHIDHYGGVLGVVRPEDVAAGKVAIIAPGRDFDAFALGENVICGNVMARRASHAFGELIPDGPRGFVTDGIGMASTQGSIGYLSPTDHITRTGESRVLAGLTFVFQMAPDTEAPQEAHLFIPELNVLTCAENANHTMHNIQTLRGARTRDAANFARYLDEALDLFGDKAQAHFGPHTWPVWGNREVREFIASQRDSYQYIHDQSLRLANHGLSPIEIAEAIELPEALGGAWWNRGYHGTLNHNAKAVYAKELGWYDGNPARLFPLPEAEAAKRYVAAMGGARQVVRLAQEAYAADDYRWAVELAGRAVFADPGDQQARDIQADACEQLGYQAEGPQWRNLYLSAAQELRDGIKRTGLATTASKDTIAAMPIDILLDFTAVRLNGPRAEGIELTINLHVTDAETPYSLVLRNAVLRHRPRLASSPELTLTLDRLTLIEVLSEPAAFDEAVRNGKVSAVGDLKAFSQLVDLLDDFDPYFDLLGPHASR
jgi:alkyl sulfatase BDS1-like metallo-beta-lactamase superfamily hydrolase